MSWQSRSERVQHIFWRANPALSLGARGHTRLKGNLDEIPETAKIVSGKCAHKSLAVLSTFIMSSLLCMRRKIRFSLLGLWEMGVHLEQMQRDCGCNQQFGQLPVCLSKTI
jgi:hypothetical protein